MSPPNTLSSAKICVVGLVRDCDKHLERQLEILKDAFGYFQDLSFFFVESDSSDQTLSVLTSLKSSHPRLSFVSLGNLSSNLPQRTARLAYCRNTYLEYLRDYRNTYGLDYFVVADMDGINSQLSASSVLSCWSTPCKWDVLTANQRGYYYDIFALRHPQWCPQDVVRQAQFLHSAGLSYFCSEWLAIYSRMIRIHSSSAPLEVDSAFGGLAIYRSHCLNGYRYSGTSPISSAPICEHVPFNYSLRSDGIRIFINPLLINSHCAPQARYAGLFGLSRFLFRCLARTFYHILFL